MNTKGISPLIATVLIIGFTIILAALVFQWGGNLFKTVQEDTATTSEAKITCASGFTNLEVSAVASPADISYTIDNKNNEEVSGYRLRAYLASGEVLAYESETVIQPYGITTLTLTTEFSSTAIMPSNFGDVTHLGLFPRITLKSGDIYTCEEETKVVVA